MLDHLLSTITIEPVELKAPDAFVQEAWNYVLPSITVFCSTVIGFKVLSRLISAAKGD